MDNEKEAHFPLPLPPLPTELTHRQPHKGEFGRREKVVHLHTYYHKYEVTWCNPCTKNVPLIPKLLSPQ
jgi:hypothetical protein